MTWWRHGAIYQVYPRSFQDSDGDGTGDLEGVRQRLPYLKWLGVEGRVAVAVLPLADGRLRLRRLRPLRRRPASSARSRTSTRSPPRRTALGLKLILDYVPNHTSIDHPWFKERPELYLWADEVPNNWVSVFGGPAWTRHEDRFYYHAYLEQQPDLDWRRNDVRAAMLDVLRFWCERGADGFRIDALRQTIKDVRPPRQPAQPRLARGRRPVRPPDPRVHDRPPRGAGL